MDIFVQRNNMKKSISIACTALLMLCFLCACAEEKEPESSKSTPNQVLKRIEIEVHPTIETFMIVRSIASNDPLFQYRDTSYTGKPMLYEARKAFAKYANHPAVAETQRMLNATSATGDVILQGLLYFEEFPSKALKYEITSENWRHRKDSLIQFVDALHTFYHDANVGEFLAAHADFYEGAIAESRTYLREDLIPTMENYFGIENLGYKMLLLTNSPFGMGFGAHVTANEGDIVYQIISPANDIVWQPDAAYDSYGYSGEGADSYYRDMVVHEFCHSFVTPFIESETMKKEIAKYDSLFVPKLDTIMSEQGYGSWWGFVNEHLVRLGEIRVAQAMEVEDLHAMRKSNVEENSFVLIPDAEKRVREYENNREKYPTFHDFIPVLIDQLQEYSREDMTSKLEQLIE